MARPRIIARGEAPIAALVAAVVLAGFVWFSNYLLIRALETRSLDLRFKLRGALPPPPEISLIMVDDASLAAFGRWPLSRHLYAEAIDRLDRAGARVIAFDMLFTEPEQAVPPSLRDAVAASLARLPPDADPGLKNALERIVSDDPDGDFADAMRTSVRVLLPIAFTFKGPIKDPDYDLSDSGYDRFVPSSVHPSFPLTPVAAAAPIERLGDVAQGLGHVSWANDADGVAHYDYLALPFDGDFIPSLPLRLAANYLGIPWPQVGLALGQGVRLGSIMVPTDAGMSMLINCLGPKGTVPTWSFADLMRGRIPESQLRGRIVLIGASVTGLNDSYASPFGGDLLSGTERLADAVDTILTQRFILSPSMGWLALTFVTTMILAGMSGAATARLPAPIVPLAGLMTIAMWCAIAQTAFLRGLWLPVVGPVAGLLLAAIAAAVFRYGVVEREGRRVRSAFRQYMAPAMVDVLAAHPERLRLGGETRCMTFLFCDVRGFTTISEQFKNYPQGLIQLINGFLTPMTDVIMARGGTIDKYMGDCIMAFWNAPLDEPRHAARACESALAMIAALRALNETRGDSSLHRPLQIGIGLNTGDCVVGNMGSNVRFDYSVLGDAVNLASRLEGQSKTYGVDIVIGDETRQQAAEYAALELDLIAVKGKTEAVRIHALLGDATVAASDTFRAFAACHEVMLDAYRRGDWTAALDALARCRDHDTGLRTLYDLYAERIAFYRSNPPGEDWNGVFVATSK